MRIVFLIRDLDRGGAQAQLRNLAAGLGRRGHTTAIACFYDGSALETSFRESGLRVLTLGKRGRWDGPRFLLRLVTTLRAERPDVVYALMSGANVASVLARPLLPKARIVWGVRSAFMDLERYEWIHAAGHGLERRLARFADRILVNSQAGRAHAIGQGFPANRLRVVENGIDTERFRPDPEARSRIRGEWGISPGERLVGLAGRIDPMKDHPTFLRAAAIAATGDSRLRFVCVGGGAANEMSELRSLAHTLGLERRLVWAGARDDMPAVYPALDLLCLSSTGEGFPNVVAEAMACDVPCVVTDVGDAPAIVGDTGGVVPSREPERLASAIIETTTTPDRQPGRRRQRIVERFGLEQLVTRTEAELLDVVEHGA